ncbi:hypothetical protein NDU88_011605 [Pleurodeles waltl]|uniref:Uncharacterized protein n=1 Tax=Pleurodeles waltl TaxID=8319 RepID=A0AAV7R1U3_PLEWA|nr:hypothetical protein NDU88_011605 [Pleurodeles waltl]
MQPGHPEIHECIGNVVFEVAPGHEEKELGGSVLLAVPLSEACSEEHPRGTYRPQLWPAHRCGPGRLLCSSQIQSGAVRAKRRSYRRPPCFTKALAGVQDLRWRRRACRRGVPEIACGRAEPAVRISAGFTHAACGEERGTAGLAVRPSRPGGPVLPRKTIGDTWRDPADPVRERSGAEAWGPWIGRPWQALPLGPGWPLLGLGLVVEPGCEEVAAEKRGWLAPGLPAEGPGLVGVGPPVGGTIGPQRSPQRRRRRKELGWPGVRARWQQCESAA